MLLPVKFTNESVKVILYFCGFCWFLFPILPFDIFFISFYFSVEITPGMIRGDFNFTRAFNMIIIVILNSCLLIPTSVPYLSLILLILLSLDSLLLFSPL